MNTDTIPPCANCQRLQAEVDDLRAQLVALQAVVEQLRKQLAAALKDSSNSSKPPSSDIVKPPKPQPPPGQSGASPAASRDTPHTSASCSRPRCSLLPPPTTSWTPAPAAEGTCTEVEALKQGRVAFQADVIVLTQACDLEQDKVRNIVACPVNSVRPAYPSPPSHARRSAGTGGPGSGRSTGCGRCRRGAGSSPACRARERDRR